MASTFIESGARGGHIVSLRVVAASNFLSPRTPSSGIHSPLKPKSTNLLLSGNMDICRYSVSMQMISWMRLYARSIQCYTYKGAQSAVQRRQERVYGEWLPGVVRCDTLWIVTISNSVYLCNAAHDGGIALMHSVVCFHAQLCVVGPLCV
jgi:hypothetical protein